MNGFGRCSGICGTDCGPKTGAIRSRCGNPAQKVQHGELDTDQDVVEDVRFAVTGDDLIELL